MLLLLFVIKVAVVAAKVCTYDVAAVASAAAAPRSLELLVKFHNKGSKAVSILKLSSD